MKTIKILLVTTGLTIAALANADEASELQAAKLLDTMNMDAVLGQAREQMLDIQLQQHPELLPFKGVINRFLEKHMSYKSLKPDMVKIYADAFTAGELQEINLFYSTATGQKAIEKIPSLMSQGAQIGAMRVQNNVVELQAMIEAEARRLQDAEQQQKLP